MAPVCTKNSDSDVVCTENLIRVMVLGILGLIRSNYHVVALQAALNETGPDARVMQKVQPGAINWLAVKVRGFPDRSIEFPVRS